MTKTELKDKYLLEIDKLTAILAKDTIDYNKFYVIKSTINKLLNIENLILLSLIKQPENKFYQYSDKLNSIRDLLNFTQNMNSSKEDIQKLLLKIKNHLL